MWFVRYVRLLLTYLLDCRILVGSAGDGLITVADLFPESSLHLFSEGESFAF